MTKFILIATGILVIGLIIPGIAQVYMAGINKQVLADVAASNQNIATRRETDAKFDKMDAAAVCADYGLKWVFADGQSHCE